MAVAMVVSQVFLLSFALLSLGAAAEFDARLPACTASGQHSKVLNFFLHDDLDTKPVASAVTVVPAKSVLNGVKNLDAFGAIAVIDDKVTEGSNVTSKLVGRGRGFYIFDNMIGTGMGLEIQFTLQFANESEFAGSTISYKGYDKIDDPVREISVVGGTGVFRMARGWADITTFSLDTSTGGAAILNVTSYLYYGCDSQPIVGNPGTKISPVISIMSIAATLSFMILSPAVL